MRWRRSGVVAAAALLALAVTSSVALAEPRDEGKRDRARQTPERAPAAPQLAPLPSLADEEPPEGHADFFTSLGGRSPLCRRTLGAEQRRSCRTSGSVTQRYPVSNYGLDVQVDTGITEIEGNLHSALHAIVGAAWLALVYLVKGVLLAFEWAFSLDLLNEALGGVRRALDRLHREVLGTPWFMAALSVAGLWGLWRGLVQQRTIQTISGLAATVGLMVGALVVINNPAGTVGHVSRLANDASLGFIAAASGGRVERPTEALGGALTGLFDTLVVGPWCALQFGDVDWCTKDRGGYRNADLWLSFPAEGKEREAIYKLTEGEDATQPGFFSDADDVLREAPALKALGALERGAGAELPDDITALIRAEPERVNMQQREGTFTRIALLALIALGLLGAITLLLYLAIKLVLAGLMSLILILLAPAMLLAPAFGESGRATFVAWAKRLLGALAAKLIYSLLLALVIVGAGALSALDIGWFGVWLLQSAYWWGIFLKREELLGFVSVGASRESEPGRFPGLARWYINAKALQAGAGVATAAATAGPSRIAGQVQQRRAVRDEANRRAVEQAAGDQLDETAAHVRTSQLRDSERRVSARPQLLDERRALSRQLAAYDERVAVARATGEEAPAPAPHERDLIARRAAIDGELASPQMQAADARVRDARRSEAQTGTPLSQRDAEAWREQRRRDIAQALPADHERNLRAAKIDPRRYQEADDREREAMRRQSEEAIERDRRLLSAARSDRAPALGHEIGSAAREIKRPERRTRTREERARVSEERRRRKTRDRLYRR